MSTKAPKSISFRTTPSWIWPGASDSSNFCRASSFSRSSTARRLSTRFRRSGFGLGDQAGEPLADELGQVLDAVQRDLADGNEAADVVDLALQPARVVAGHVGVDQHPFVQIGPVGDFDGPAGQAQFVQAVVGIEFLHDHLEGVAGLGGRLELPQRQAALFATAQLDEDLAAADGRHAGRCAAISAPEVPRRRPLGRRASVRPTRRRLGGCPSRGRWGAQAPTRPAAASRSFSSSSCSFVSPPATGVQSRRRLRR